MSTIGIAALQLALPEGDNFDRISAAIERCLKRFPWLDMLVLPELATFGVPHSKAQTFPADVEAAYAALAKKHNVWLIPGSHYESSEDKLFNTASVISPEGEVVNRHRKIYPWLPYEQQVDCGEQFCVFDVPGKGRVGLIVCYDNWFPEVCRQMAHMGAEIILCPTLTNTIDREIEKVIARANAAINQCYFVSVNAAGELGCGQSIVIGPEGDILHEADGNERVIPLVYDFERVRRVREVGALNLCQTLKSHRDNPIRFTYLDPNAEAESALSQLGKMKIPERGE